MSVGQNIKRRRRELDMTLEAVAKEVGLSRQTLSRYETGVIGNIPSDKVEALAKVLRTTPSALMGWEDPSALSADTISIREKFPAQNIAPIQETYQVPRLGQIACGQPILAEQNIETYDLVPVSIRCDFTLICRGDSMIGAGIEDGDIVYIREQPEVETGEIAAVMVGEDEATLKRFKRVGDTVLLIPENSSYEPMVFAGGDMNGIRILGKAVGFTRYFRE